MRCYSQVFALTVATHDCIMYFVSIVHFEIMHVCEYQIYKNVFPKKKLQLI